MRKNYKHDTSKKKYECRGGAENKKEASLGFG